MRMTSNLVWVFLGFILASHHANGLVYESQFSVAGKTGTVTFTPGGANMNIAVTDFQPDVTPYDVMRIVQLPPIFGQLDNSSTVCGSLGAEIDLLNGARTNETNNGFSLTQASLPEDTIFNRGLVMMDSSGTEPTICAIISPVDKSEIITFRAAFTGPVVGVMWMRKRSSLDGVFIYSDLAFSDDRADPTGSETLSVSSHSGGNIGTTNYTARCSELTGPTTIAELTVGNSVTSTARRFGSFDASLLTLDPMTLGLSDSSDVVACSSLTSVAGRSVTSLFNWRNVRGSIEFEQNSPFEITKTTVQISGLPANVLNSTYHIHLYPVPQRLTNTVAQRCNGVNVGGHFNPYDFDIGTSPPAGTGTNDQYELGDLSGKYGYITSSDFSETYYDWNLPLWGPNRVAGRSIVIHQTLGARYACASIRFEDATTIAVVNFRSPAYGTMYFRQASGDPNSETAVFGQLANLNGITSLAHNYHVHVYPIGEDCASAGGHYNPTEVSIAQPTYGTECSETFPYRCELGDLSGKHGPIDIVGSLQTGGRFFFQDNFMPLSGAYSIIGRSIVIHNPNREGPRYACANITQLFALSAQTEYNDWRGNDTDGTVTGSFTFTQNSEYDRTQVNSNVVLTGGNSTIFGITNLPILSSTSGLEQCTSVGLVYNPFNASETATRGVNTPDLYPVGDISGKDNANINTINFQDDNLPLGTPVSAAGRGMALFKDAASWKCNNVLLTSQQNTSYVMEAEVVYSGDYNGIIKLRQVVYEDGSSTPTSIEVQLYSTNGVNSNGHNWHVHIQPITNQSSCGAAAGHYDPYEAFSMALNYSSACTRYNPLACEVGDLSRKQGQFDINPANRQLYVDVDVPLHTQYTVLGRSIVFHIENGGAARLVCANIVPVNTTKTYTLGFPSSAEYDYYRFQSAVASVLQIARQRVVIVHNNYLPHNNSGCLKVMVAIAGPVDPARETLLLAGTGLDPYLPYVGCTNMQGLLVLAEPQSTGTGDGGCSNVQFNSLLMLFTLATWLLQYLFN